MIDGRISRRRILTVPAAASIAGAGTIILSACGSKSTPTASVSSSAIAGNPPTAPSPTTAESTTVTAPAPAPGIPKYIPFTGVKADFPSVSGSMPAFLKYPAQPLALPTDKPASGGTMSSAHATNTPPAPTVSSNPFWQELNKRLGAEYQQNTAVTDDYQTKLPALLAGGDLPDFVQLYLTTPNLPGVLKAEFQDLTEYLSGDAIAPYPNLANLPSGAWENLLIDGGLYGIPNCVGPIFRALIARKDIIDKKGLNANLANGDDFLALCKGLTDVKANTWAFTTPDRIMQFVAQMTGAPNTWKITDGQFTRDWETEEYRQALGVMAQCWKSGWIYPDAFTSGVSTMLDLVATGKVALSYEALGDWPGYYLPHYSESTPDIAFEGVVPPKWSGGGQAGTYLSNELGDFFTALPKAAPTKIKERLTVLDWLAAPFGTDRGLFLSYGIKGRDYTLNGTDPVVTDTGTNEVQHMYLGFVARGPAVLYSPGQPEATEAVHNFAVSLLKVGVPWPTRGLISTTDYSGTGAALTKKMNDAISDVIQGRKSLSDWDKTVQSWRTGGGDKIKKEYANAYAAAHK
jgi:putative aldouronate transport system substrate-binding protein